MKKLTIEQRIQFLDLLAQMASYATFERVLNLEPNEVKAYQRELDIQSPDEARKMAKRLKKENNEAIEARIVSETKKVKEAEEIANKRLRELEVAKNKTKPVKEYDVNAIKEEDAIRQKIWESQQAEINTPDEVWELSLYGSKSQREEQVEQFKRDIVYRGINFCVKKYSADPTQIRFEAERLKLDINWDSVRR